MTFDVVIIGGGIYGSACSFFLKNDKNKVLLLEKNKIGSSGATSYSRGITRVYDPDETLHQISMDSIRAFLNWEKGGLPGKSPYTNSGFLYILNKNKEKEALAFTEKMKNLDYSAEILSSTDLRKFSPWLQTSDEKIGIFEKDAGFGDPALTALNFAQGFKSKGGSLFENCEVKGIQKKKNGLWKIDLLNQSIESKVVLVTVGAYSKQLIPESQVFTRSITLTQILNPPIEVNHSIVDEEIETYVRPGDGGTFYCGSQVYESADLPHQLKESSPSESLDSITRIKKLLNMPDYKGDYLARIKGYDSYTKDKRPVVQFIDKGLYFAAGFSGRGYKCSLAIAKGIASQINNYLEGKTFENKLEWRIKLHDLELA